LWDLTRREPIRQCTPSSVDYALGDGALIVAVAFAPDGETFAISWLSYRHGPMYVKVVGRGISLWDTATGKERRLGGWAQALTFLDGGKTLVAADPQGPWAGPGAGRSKGAMQFWDVATGKKRREHGAAGKWGNVVAFSPEGKLFASAGGPDDHAVSLWETATGRKVHRFSGHRCPVCCLAFSPDGRMLASGSDDTTILVWEVPGVR
jgi:WD40 repeat protein